MTSKRRQTDSFVNKRSYLNSKHIQYVHIKINYFYRRLYSFTCIHNLLLLRLSTTSKIDVNNRVTFFLIRIYRQYTTEEGFKSTRKHWSFYWIKVSQLRYIFVFCLLIIQFAETIIRYIDTYYDTYTYIGMTVHCRH